MLTLVCRALMYDIIVQTTRDWKLEAALAAEIFPVLAAELT